MNDRVRIVDASDGPELPVIPDGAGRAWAVIWPGIGAELRSLHRISLPGGTGTVPLSHPGEAVYYAVEGSGEVSGERGERDQRSDGDAGTEAGEQTGELTAGGMVHIGPRVEYRVRASEDSPLELVGGPAPADHALYAQLTEAPGAGALADTPDAGRRADAPSADASGIDSSTGAVVAGGDQRDRLLEAARAAAGSAPDGVNPGIRLLHRDRPDRMLPLVASDARLIAWPGTGAETANMNYVDMKPGEENVPHSHAFSEDTIFILAGRGTIRDLTNGDEHEFGAGQVIHVPPGVEHQVRADRGESIVSVGGPCPADVPMLRAGGLLE